MEIKWWSSNSLVGSEREGILVIDDVEIEKMREAGYTEEAIQNWVKKEVKEEVMNYFEWGYEIEKCSCYKLGKSLNSGMKCSNCSREL